MPQDRPDDFTMSSVRLKPRQHARAAATTAGLGALVGLLPTLVRRTAGRRSSPGRTMREAGGGAALGALVPLLSSWQARYHGPAGPVGSWDDLRDQLYMPPARDKTAAEKQAALPLLVPLAGAAKVGLKGLMLATAAGTGARAVGSHRQAGALDRAGQSGAAADMRRARNWQAASAGLLAAPVGWATRGLGYLPGVSRLAAKVAPKAVAAGKKGTRLGRLGRGTARQVAPLVPFYAAEGAHKGYSSRAYANIGHELKKRSPRAYDSIINSIKQHQGAV